MRRFLRKLFKPKPEYEPAGIIHYGELCSTWTDAYRRADHHARHGH